METHEKLIELRKIPCPVRFVFADKPFVIEIQYFITPSIVSNNQSVDGLVNFAVNTDGWGLYVDARHCSNGILQKEFDNAYPINVTLDDLLRAENLTL